MEDIEGLSQELRVRFESDVAEKPTWRQRDIQALKDILSGELTFSENIRPNII
jgi:putative heme degradation protein